MSVYLVMHWDKDGVPMLDGVFSSQQAAESFRCAKEALMKSKGFNEVSMFYVGPLQVDYEDFGDLKELAL